MLVGSYSESNNIKGRVVKKKTVRIEIACSLLEGHCEMDNALKKLSNTWLTKEIKTTLVLHSHLLLTHKVLF